LVAPTPMEYQFDYELPPSNPLTRAQKLQILQRRRAKGFVFLDDSNSGTYYYDLKTRFPIAGRIKRLIDIVASVAIITMISPLLLGIMLLIKLTSPGPIMFFQRRIGFRCNEFEIYKFRTMVVGADKMNVGTDGNFLKPKNDPRITPIGRFLRKYSLDELPQLFNVLEGTMSLVGPRPLLVSDLQKLPLRARLSRFSMPPGCTGLWQVSGRSDCSDAKRMQLDREYVARWSLKLDWEILLRTIDVVFTGRGAV
jgi:lipopolysaccharide/colanic/teichoic acid biosynthesis glycosyltransferase